MKIVVCYSAAWGRFPWGVRIGPTVVVNFETRDEALAWAERCRHAEPITVLRAVG